MLPIASPAKFTNASSADKTPVKTAQKVRKITPKIASEIKDTIASVVNQSCQLSTTMQTILPVQSSTGATTSTPLTLIPLNQFDAQVVSE